MEKKLEAGEPEIKTGKSPGAKEKRDLNGRSTNSLTLQGGCGRVQRDIGKLTMEYMHSI